MRLYAKKDKSAHGLPRQQVAFLEKVRKIVGRGSLREDFYTKFKPKLGIGSCDMARK